MLPRSFEVLMVTLLILVTVLATFTFLNYQVQTQNQKLMLDMLTELRMQREIASLASRIAPGVADLPIPAEPTTPKPITTKPALTVATPAAPVASQPAPTIKPATPALPTATAKPTTPPPPPPAESPQDIALWNKHEKQLTDIMQQLLGGKYEPIVKQFDPHMAANLTAPQLAAVLDPIRKQHGQLTRIVSHNRLTDGLPKTMTAFQILCELADKHHISFTITLDSKNRIAGLMMR